MTCGVFFSKLIISRGGKLMSQSSRLNINKCKANARDVLEEYRKNARIADMPLSDLQSPTISSIPKAATFDNVQEIKNTKVIDAINDVDEINKALRNLSTKNYAAVYYTFLSRDEYTRSEIGELIHASESTVDRRKDMGLLQFCHTFKHGKLLVYRK